MDRRYEILEATAGEGGFGRVDKAFDRELEREVAIKTLDPLFKTQASPQDIARFRREAKVLARLSNPHIPAIYDVQFSEQNEEFKIIFEWIEGVSLREHLQERGVLGLEDARQLFSRLCSALAHAHDHAIIHRDIKPSNIILTPDIASAYLVDFGISLRQDELSRITGGSPVGTAGYMSPEQERGDELTSASDIFSLGIVLYECLSGGRPTVGGYRSLSAHNESIPPSIDTLIQEALREDPLRRPASARDFNSRLTQALRPHSSFTATLADGSLFEIQLALNQMDSAGYAALPHGQRVLLVTRLRDLVSVDEPRMRFAVAAFLTELVRVGHEASLEHYATIVHQTFQYGYEKQYGDTWQGQGNLREALNRVALICGRESHSIITKKVLHQLGAAALEEKQGWYRHDLRVLLQNLLTNASCDEGNAEPLGDALARVNEAQHEARPSGGLASPPSEDVRARADA